MFSTLVLYQNRKVWFKIIMENLLRVGVIASTHGLKGEVNVFPTTDDLNRFKNLKNVILDLKREQIDLEIEGVKFFKKFAILKFKGYDHIDDVQRFLKKDLLVTRENAVKLKEGEYFICDLIGLKVITDEDVELGTLTDIFQTGANDVYVVTNKDNKEILLPSIPQCILNKDLEQGIIKVHILKGLLDL